MNNNNQMIVAILTKSKIKAPKTILRSLDTLNLRYMHNMIFKPNQPHYLGMFKKLRNYVAWSILPKDLSDSISKDRTIIYCNPPYKGYVKGAKRYGYFDIESFKKLILNKFIYRRKSKETAQVS